MASVFARTFQGTDWFLFGSAFAITILGLLTMRSFTSENFFFERQLIWIAVSVPVCFLAAMGDYSFLRRTRILMTLYIFTLILLTLIFAFGAIVKGSQNRFDLGILAVQPSDPAKLLLVALLAKYFARRHIEIAHIRHILVSGAYAFAMFVLVFLQPDFGSGIIITAIWLGMVLVSGISWKHLATLFIAGTLVLVGAWNFVLMPYQKQRVMTFVNPLADIRGSGYNAYQSMVAVGSGEMLGKGVGYGTQSKLQFLPEYQTDFIFAGYAEEWGFVGVVLLLGLFVILVSRILLVSAHGSDNFDTLFAAGIAIYFSAQFIVHVGMNIGLMPITGTTLPFMSYGGSHLLTEYLALGMLMSIRRNARPMSAVRDNTELIGAV